MRRPRLLVAPLAALGLLAACGKSESTAPGPPARPTAASSATPAPSVPASPAAAPSVSRDPAKVLVDWARAVSLRDWDTAFAYWGEHGEASGMTRDQFRAAWNRLNDPVVEVGPGQQEGAAGSSYYTAPVTITDGARRLSGEVVLRRANDVPGATLEQLRWHIESSTLEP